MANELSKDAIQEIQKIVTAGMGVDSPQEEEAPTSKNLPFVLVPDGYRVESLEKLVYNEHNPTPERVKANVTVLDAASFVEYCRLFSDPNSRIFADETTISVVGVMDYHGAAEGGPRWCQHRVKLALRESEDWKTWIGSNSKTMTQQQFSEFLEQNSFDIKNPDPARILEVAADLQATTEVEFGSGLRQQDGQVRFKYTETTNAKMGGGKVEVPSEFTICIPVFIGSAPVDIRALLRFRTKDGHLTFFYTLLRPEAAKRQAFIASRDAIAADLGIKVINGSPQA